MSFDPNFNQHDHETWSQLFLQLAPLRSLQLIPEFSVGLELLAMDAERIPVLSEVNNKLKKFTGWQGVYAEGFVEAEAFFKMLSDRKFPIGNFIRDAKDLSYTPEPDVFHDLYGHIPFFTIPAYAEFCKSFGDKALQASGDAKALTEYQRLFWFTIEFSLIETSEGKRIFGAGIASSFAECAYALSDKPRVLPFNVEEIKNKDFRIDLIQEDLFLLRSQDQLYRCLDQL